MLLRQERLLPVHEPLTLKGRKEGRKEGPIARAQTCLTCVHNPKSHRRQRPTAPLPLLLSSQHFHLIHHSRPFVLRHRQLQSQCSSHTCSSGPSCIKFRTRPAIDVLRASDRRSGNIAIAIAIGYVCAGGEKKRKEKSRCLACFLQGLGSIVR